MDLLLTVVNFFHIIFIAWGVGGATIATILMAKGEKEPTIMPVIMKLIGPISKLIWVSIIGLIITGIILAVLGYANGDIDKNILMIKQVVVAILILNGLFLNFKLLPKLKKSTPAPASKPSVEFFKFKKYMKISSILSLILWYAIVLLGVML